MSAVLGMREPLAAEGKVLTQTSERKSTFQMTFIGSEEEEGDCLGCGSMWGPVLELVIDMIRGLGCGLKCSRKSMGWF